MRMWMAVVCAAAFAAACAGGASKSAAPANDPKTEAQEPAVLPAASTGATTEFGVRECDDYFAKYTECVSSKVPVPVRTAMVTALAQSKNQWKAAAITPEGRAGLAQACTQALDAAKASMQAYGCRW